MKVIAILLLLIGSLSMGGCCLVAAFTQKARTPWEVSRDRRAEEYSRIAKTTKTAKGILVRLETDILFETGKAELSPKADKQLDLLAKAMLKYPKDRITLTGHTDNVGSNEDNMVLSRNRAKALKDRLVRDGVAPKDVKSIGMGETVPLVDNDTAEHRTLNRRAEMDIEAID